MSQWTRGARGQVALHCGMPEKLVKEVRSVTAPLRLRFGITLDGTIRITDLPTSVVVFEGSEVGLVAVLLAGKTAAELVRGTLESSLRGKVSDGY